MAESPSQRLCHFYPILYYPYQMLGVSHFLVSVALTVIA